MDKLLVYFTCFFLSFSISALPTDRNQVMKLFSDSAKLSQAIHEGEYIGNVKLTQGTTNLNAARVITKGNEKNQLTLAIAFSNNKNQVHYWVKVSADKPMLHAFADEIYYYPLKNLIVLKGNAKIIQGKNSFSGANISYDTVKQSVLSESNNKLRTTIIFYPEKKLK